MTTWIKLVLLALSVVAGWWGLSSFDYKQYLSPTALAQWLNDAGPWAPLLLIGSMICAVVIPPIPSLPLVLAAGAAFGPFDGALYAVIGAEIGATVCFLVARAWGREALARVMKTEATFGQMCTDHQLMGVVFFARLIPILSFEVSYGAGLTKISLKSFALATLFGMAPPTLAFTYMGSSVVSAQWPLIAAGAAMVLFFLAMPELLTKYRTGAFARLFLGRRPLRLWWQPDGSRFRFRSAAPTVAQLCRPHDGPLHFHNSHRFVLICSIFLSGARLAPSTLLFPSTQQDVGRY